MSHARDTFGTWLRDAVTRRLPTLHRDFDLSRSDQSDRRQPAMNAASGIGDGMAQRDKPAPALKPPPAMRTQADREHFNARWLTAQRDAAIANAPEPVRDQEHGPTMGRTMEGPSR